MSSTVAQKTSPNSKKTAKSSSSVERTKSAPSPSSAAATAMYHKQMKYGVYEQPGAPVVGVPSSSSGSAAVLASKADLSLKLWHHDNTSAAAGTAAILANEKKTSPKIWKPDASASAASAALHVKDYNPAADDESDYTLSANGAAAALNERNASLAALSAHKTPGSDMAAQALPDAYAWGDSATGRKDLVRSASVQVFKEDEIESQNRRARAQSQSESRQADLSKNIVGVEKEARNRASQRLSGLKAPQPSVYASQKEIDRYTAQHAAASSSFAAKQDTGEIAEQMKAKEHDRMLKESLRQHDSLMKAARARASDSLSMIDKNVNERDLFRNVKLNQAAYDIAESKYKDRMKNHGKIDIGGGVFMTQSEIDQVAQRNVQPVLDEITEKAETQRQADEEKRQADEEERQRKAEEKRLNQERKAEEKRLKREEHQRQKAEHGRVKQIEKERKQKLKQERKELAEQRKQERIKLKSAMEEKKNAEALAKSEVSKAEALQAAVNAKVEAARIKEQEAEDEAAAEAARLEKEQNERELEETTQKLEQAKLEHAEKEKATKEAESVIDEHDRESAAMVEGVIGDDEGVESDASDVEDITDTAVTASDTPYVSGITADKLEGPTVSKLQVSEGGDADKAKKVPTNVQLPYTPGLSTEKLEGPTVSKLAVNDSENKGVADEDEWDIVEKKVSGQEDNSGPAGDDEVGIKEVKQSKTEGQPSRFTEGTESIETDSADDKPETVVETTSGSPKKNRVGGLFKQLRDKASSGRIRGLSGSNKEKDTQENKASTTASGSENATDEPHRFTDSIPKLPKFGSFKSGTPKEEKKPLATPSDNISTGAAPVNSAANGSSGGASGTLAAVAAKAAAGPTALREQEEDVEQPEKPQQAQKPVVAQQKQKQKQKIRASEVDDSAPLSTEIQNKFSGFSDTEEDALDEAENTRGVFKEEIS